MSFLRRLFGGDGPSPTTPIEQDRAAAAAAAVDEDDEVFGDQQGPPSELVERQIRYAAYAWTPPAQGGERRADDLDEG